jgi:probable rRNA maturation factor
MGEDYPQVELNIDVDDNKIQASILETLPFSELELVVKLTLHLAGITQPVALSLLITGDETIHTLNKQYRQQDKPTDVLSFPLLDKPLVSAPADQLWLPLEEAGTPHAAKTPLFVTPPELPTNLGDIVISWSAVLRQATDAGINSVFELFYLVSHGVLHLIGYDDASEAGYQAMVRLQQSVLQAMGQKAQPT